MLAKVPVSSVTTDAKMLAKLVDMRWQPETIESNKRAMQLASSHSCNHATHLDLFSYGGPLAACGSEPPDFFQKISKQTVVER
jgi:hypothetical protein